jgi:hypothetical protein
MTDRGDDATEVGSTCSTRPNSLEATQRASLRRGAAFMTETSAGQLDGADGDASMGLSKAAKSTTISPRQVALDDTKIARVWAASPKKSASAKLLAKSRGTGDSDDSEQDELMETVRGHQRTAAAAVAGRSRSPARSVASTKSAKPTLLNTPYPGIDPSIGAVAASDAVPLDHAAVQSVIDSVTAKDPSLAHDRNVTRFVRTREFSQISISVFWIAAMRCKLTAFNSTSHERVLRGESQVLLQQELERSEQMATTSEAEGFRCAAVAYGVTFGSMMARQGHSIESAVSIRDSLFQRLPVLLSKTVYYLLTLVFSAASDHLVFNAAVKEDLLVLMSRWITGVEPQNAQIQAATPWPKYSRRKEVKQASTFDADTMTKTLDEASAVAFQHAQSLRMLSLGNDLASSFNGFRRGRGGDDASSLGRSSSMRRGKGAPRLDVTLRSSNNMASLKSSASEKSSVKDAMSTVGVASPTSVKLRAAVPTLHDGGRWYEQGGCRGSLTVERVTEPASPRQPWSITAHSPFIAYYLQQMDVAPIDPSRTGKPMQWTVLTALDRRGTTFKFGAHAKPLAKKAIAYCREDRRVLDSIVDRERRDVVASQRGARYNAGKAKLAAMHIRALHSLRFAKTQEVYEQLRAKLQHAIQKSARRGDAHITEVITLANNVLAEVSERVYDLPYPARAELQRLSLACFRGVHRLNRFHKIVMEDAAAKEHLTYHSLSDAGSAALARIFDQAHVGVNAEDIEVSELLRDAASIAAHVYARPPSSSTVGNDSEGEDAHWEAALDAAEDWVILPTDAIEADADMTADSFAGGGNGGGAPAMTNSATFSESHLLVPTLPGPTHVRGDHETAATDSTGHLGVDNQNGAFTASPLSDGKRVSDPGDSAPPPRGAGAMGTTFHGSKRPSVAGEAVMLPSGSSYNAKKIEALAHLESFTATMASMPSTARAGGARRSSAAGDLLTSMAPTPPATARPTTLDARVGSSIGAVDQLKLEAAWRLAREAPPDRTRPVSVFVMEDSTAVINQHSPDVSIAIPKELTASAFYTPRVSRASPLSSRAEGSHATADGVAQSPRKEPAVPSPLKAKQSTTCKRHSQRQTLDESNTTARAVEPPTKLHLVQPPKAREKHLPWWQAPPEDPACVVSSSDDTRRPETTPHFQRSTTARQLKTSGVAHVALSVERQVAMATAAAAKAAHPAHSLLPSINAAMLRRAVSHGEPGQAVSPTLTSPSRPATQSTAALLTGRSMHLLL